ncbi:MAG: hypothetical protein R3D99_12515 [Altererythrobacter sp.]
MDSYSGSRRKSGSFQAIIGVALSALLLAGVVAGYFWWRGDYSADDAEGVAAATGPQGPSLGAKSPLPDPSATATEAAQNPTQAVERVAEQQGGIESRLAAAEQRLARLDLQAQAASGNAGRAEGLLIAFAARRTLERGEQLGYLGDQLKLRFGIAQPGAVRIVLEASERPIRLDQLIARLEGLGPTLVTPNEGPSFSRFRKELGDLFVIRRETTASTRPDRALYRARLSLEAGRVEKAIEEVQTLPGADAAAAWIADARRYASIQNALNILETSAIGESSGLRDSEGQKIEQPSPVEKTTE